LFALLLLHRNTTVSIEKMADVLWPTRAPPNAVAVLRTYIARLRAGVLEPGALVTRPGGYELQVAPGEVDVDRLEALALGAGTDLARGDATRAEEGLIEALALVRGPVLAELADDREADAERTRLEELLAALGEDLTEARLAQGDHRELVPVLSAAVADQPLRERLWGQLMVALYRCGRQADALNAYRRAHRTLAELGLQPGPALRVVERMILVQDPALSTWANRERRVPQYATSLVARREALDALADSLRSGGLVTVVGPAGAGKSRLAAEAAARAESWLGPHVWWVELDAVRPGRAIAATGRVLAAPDVPGLAPLDGIVARLREAPSLLVLDNCEHVLDEVATLVADLLERSPRTRVLTTSREILRVGGERVHRLGGLELEPAAQLFCERAVLPPDDSDAVAEIVARLDGLPLAIELAAAKTGSVSVAELSRGLHERLTLLEGGPRDAPARQRTLEAALDWSYDLRSSDEQRVLRRLAIFPGSFEASAAAAVGGDGVLPALARLVDASLVAADPPRYRLLMTVRTYARERLRETDEEDDALRCHRAAYLELAEALDHNMTGDGLAEWLVRGRLEHENFLFALRGSLSRGDADAAITLAARLAIFWFRIGFIRDGRALLERALAAATPGGSVWPRALYGRALLAHADNAPETRAFAKAAVRAAERAEEGELLACGLALHGHGLMMAGRLDEARTQLHRARSVAIAAGSQEGIGFTGQLLGNLALAAGDLDTAGDLLMRARDHYRRTRVTLDAGYTLIDLARVRLAQGRFDDARATAGEAVADFRRRGDPRGVAGALLCLGQAYAALGQSERAQPVLAEAQSLADQWGFVRPSAQPDELRQEPLLGAGVEPLNEEGSVARLVRSKGDQAGHHLRVAEEHR
jgi:predicted ATPase/DNA-binding SARP family transcriptional activator